ncbi:5-methyltetrahydropteroyltriglutamate--homocysteine S-methyltransferase [Allonocardiopsis opalescens]|uniref:5-methyltetrahydropteroyltriglutamate--homocysteine methyltransferase n=1 Tax=Allonocardiopsis opalescens TaxID=1144618 RepID=A0A2T0Q0C4_9ACTN|nr:5-methyltetrahydropteroyltriglutamate--homocysteine S-methyltransferase [Allonocardiopsis opalescens]PRX97234.1 methionine synthase (B12-independent) [Allonocardiopsis opalescens]
MNTPVPATSVHGYPHIGPRRELKRAVEGYWAGRTTAAELDAAAAALRRDAVAAMAAAGIAAVPSNTFTYYDQMLDTALLFGAVPERFRAAAAAASDRAGELDAYFAMARGSDAAPPLEMTKWFDTNYHYLVPEIGPATPLRLSGAKPVEEFEEARAQGVETRPVLIGPLTFLLLSKPDASAPEGFAPLDRLDELLPCYGELLERLHRAGAAAVRLDEPALAADRTPEELAALRRAYRYLGEREARPAITVSTYFGAIGAALPVLAAAPVEGVGLDFVAGPANRDALAAAGGLGGKVLEAGLVDGRNVWRTDLGGALAMAASLLGLAGGLTVSTSCSLQHVPLDLAAETGLDPRLRERLAFARQKLDELALIALGLAEGTEALGDRLAAGRPAGGAFTDHQVRARLDALGAGRPRADYAVRVRAQRQGGAGALPPLATTTIGSFPQTAEVRAARAGLRAGRLPREEYERLMRAEIDRVIALQEDIGLDVLVHGEPERNDMVQYFAEQLAGYAATEHGWVQSYGSRYVRPPILFGDVSRPAPMTVEWARYAQSRTAKPVKGMLTGPVTMLAWSFVRDDQPLAETARQVALALRDEVRDLEAAGIRHIQVDEPALRELLPLRRDEQPAYLAWAAEAFRLATSGVADTTTVHTHMCYSEFGEVIGAIGELDADVTSVEAARSRMELVADLRDVGYRREIGPGVYDIHSPRVPSEEEIEAALRRALAAVEPDRLWVNPDCGLKTRGYAEVEPALRNLVSAARRVRESLGS